MGLDKENIKKRLSQIELDINQMNQMIDDNLQLAPNPNTAGDIDPSRQEYEGSDNEKPLDIETSNTSEANEDEHNTSNLLGNPFLASNSVGNPFLATQPEIEKSEHLGGETLRLETEKEQNEDHLKIDPVSSKINSEEATKEMVKIHGEVKDPITKMMSTPIEEARAGSEIESEVGTDSQVLQNSTEKDEKEEEKEEKEEEEEEEETVVANIDELELKEPTNDHGDEFVQNNEELMINPTSQQSELSRVDQVSGLSSQVLKEAPEVTEAEAEATEVPEATEAETETEAEAETEAPEALEAPEAETVQESEEEEAHTTEKKIELSADEIIHKPVDLLAGESKIDPIVGLTATQISTPLTEQSMNATTTLIDSKLSPEVIEPVGDSEPLHIHEPVKVTEPEYTPSPIEELSFEQFQPTSKLALPDEAVRSVPSMENITDLGMVDNTSNLNEQANNTSSKNESNYDEADWEEIHDEDVDDQSEKIVLPKHNNKVEPQSIEVDIVATKQSSSRSGSNSSNQRRSTNPFRVVSVTSPNSERIASAASATSDTPIASRFNEKQSTVEENIVKLQRRHDYLSQKCAKLSKEIDYLTKMNSQSTLDIEDTRKLTNALKKLQEYLDKKTKEKYEVGVLLSRKLRRQINLGENGEFWIGTK